MEDISKRERHLLSLYNKLDDRDKIKIKAMMVFKIHEYSYKNEYSYENKIINILDYRCVINQVEIPTHNDL